MMRLVADESVEAQIAEALRRAGHEVLEIAATNSGIADTDVMDLALERGDLMITNDKDFGDLVFSKGRKHHGIVLMRLSGVPMQDKCARVVMVIGTHGRDLLGSFTVIGPKTVRVRNQF